MAAKDYDHLFKLLIIGEFSTDMSHYSSGHWTLTTRVDSDSDGIFLVQEHFSLKKILVVNTFFDR